MLQLMIMMNTASLMLMMNHAAVNVYDESDRFINYIDKSVKVNEL